MLNLRGRSYIMSNDQTLELTRQSRTLNSGVSYVGGELVVDDSATTTYTIRCNVQPVDDPDLQIQPGGQQQSARVKIYTQDLANRMTTGDTFVRDGVIYQIQEVDYWHNHQRAVAINSQVLAELPDE